MKHKTIVCALLLTLLLTTFNRISFAANYDITWNGVLDDGVDDMYYWIDSGCTYTDSIPASVQMWAYPGWWNPINLYQTSNYSSSTMDFYEYYDSNSNVYAYAESYKYGASSPMPIYLKDSEDWRYGRIYINEAKMLPQTPSRRKAIICHEMGHVFGLKDIDTSSSIMYRYGNLIPLQVTLDANNAIVTKYPRD